MIILATDLHGICYMISSTTDLGGIHDTILVHADLDGICHRTASTTDLNELCCKSHDLPNSVIPVLPSYELTDLLTSCTSRPMTEVFAPVAPIQSIQGVLAIAAF